jgi:hypothetical protein
VTLTAKVPAALTGTVRLTASMLIPRPRLHGHRRPPLKRTSTIAARAHSGRCHFALTLPAGANLRGLELSYAGGATYRATTLKITPYSAR